MKPIVKVIDKLGRTRRVEVVRKVNIYDFLSGKDYITPQEYDPDKCSRVQCSTGLKIRPEVIIHLLKKFNIETFDGKSGVTYRKRLALRGLTHEWHPEYAATFFAVTGKDISYRGLRKEGPSRENRWNREWELNNLTWRLHRDSFIQEQLDIVDEQIDLIVKTVNQEFDDELIDFVQNVNVNAGWLEERREEFAKGCLVELAKVEEEIISLKKRRSELDLELAKCDRQSVIKYLANCGLSAKTKERVDVIAAECMDKLPTSRSRRFG